MLIDHRTKTLVLMNPKTGTSSLRVMFRDFISPEYYHIRWHELDSSLASYTKYAFYRDPIERFISGYSYLCQVYYKGFYKDPVTRSRIELVLQSLDCETPQQITVDKVLDAKYNDRHGAVLDILDPQIEWIGNNEINLLNFNNFNSECGKLFAAFNINPVKVEQVNITEPITLTLEQIQRVKGYYKEDYEYAKDLL